MEKCELCVQLFADDDISIVNGPLYFGGPSSDLTARYPLHRFDLNSRAKLILACY